MTYCTRRDPFGRAVCIHVQTLVAHLAHYYGAPNTTTAKAESNPASDMIAWARLALNTTSSASGGDTTRPSNAVGVLLYSRQLSTVPEHDSSLNMCEL